MSLDCIFPPSRQSQLKSGEVGIVFNLPYKSKRLHRVIKKNNEWTQWFYGNHSVSMNAFRCIEDGAFYAIEYEKQMYGWLMRKLEELQIINNFMILEPDPTIKLPYYTITDYEIERKIINGM